MLICCVLFYCIEVSRGDYDTALKHVKSGLHILQEWKKTQADQPNINIDSGPAEEIEELMQVFARLDVQVRIFEDGQPPHLLLTTLEERLGIAYCVPVAFKTLREAWAVMDKLTNWIFHILATQAEHNYSRSVGQLGGDIKHQKLVLHDQLIRWSDAFDIFMKEQENQIEQKQGDKASATMLSIIYHGTIALYSLSVTGTKKNSININYHFEKILILSEAMIDDSGGSQQPKGISFETGEQTSKALHFGITLGILLFQKVSGRLTILKAFGLQIFLEHH